MTQPWYPFYWSDYSGKTMHLSMGQHGAYLLFLRWIYTTEKPIPHKQRYSIARAMTEQEQGDADLVLQEFFTYEETGGGLWNSKRASEVIEETKNRHEKRVIAGKMGGLSKSSNARAMLEQRHSNALVTTPTTTTTTTSGVGEETNTCTPTINTKTPIKGGLKNVGRVVGVGQSFRIEQHLKDDELIDAKAAAPGWDLYHLMRVYDEGIASGKRSAPKKPGAAFLAWVPLYTKGKRPS